MAFVSFQNVSKVYKTGEVTIEALHDVNFEIEKGEICVIVGESGAGKTTLLQRLTAYFGPRAAFHEERPQDNPYINEYYSDSKRWSFHSQVSFLSLYFDDEKWRPEVGDNVVIGGNAFLTESVESDTKVSIKKPEMTFRVKGGRF